MYNRYLYYIILSNIGRPTVFAHNRFVYLRPTLYLLYELPTINISASHMCSFISFNNIILNVVVAFRILDHCIFVFRLLIRFA